MHARSPLDERRGGREADASFTQKTAGRPRLRLPRLAPSHRMRALTPGINSFDVPA